MNAVIWPKSTAGDDAWPECSSSLPPSWEGSSAGRDTLKPGAGAPLSWRPTSRDPARPLVPVSLPWALTLPADSPLILPPLHSV